MGEISIESVTGKLNRVGYDAFIHGLRHAKSAGKCQGNLLFCPIRLFSSAATSKLIITATVFDF